MSATTWQTGQVDQLELTDVHGAENLQRIRLPRGDIVLGDRYYARPRDLRPVIDAGADFIVVPAGIVAFVAGERRAF